MQLNLVSDIDWLSKYDIENKNIINKVIMPSLIDLFTIPINEHLLHYGAIVFILKK